MSAKKRGREVSGVLFLDKPKGLTSNAAMQRVRRLLDAKKAGHTGSLDPMASGLLPICLGEATKFAQWGLDADKGYRATVKLGQTTTTGDAEGELLSEREAGHLQQTDIERVLPDFTGPIEQIPPMYSALKVEGQPLYKLARQGKSVERKPRKVVIYELRLTHFDGDANEAELDVRCSKGTYVRTLAEDIGEALKVGAHLTALRRTGLGKHRVEDSYRLEKIEQCIGLEKQVTAFDVNLQPVDTLISDIPAVHISDQAVCSFQQGQTVINTEAYRLLEETDIVRVLDNQGSFLGIGSVLDEGRVQPKRLVKSS